MASYKEGMLKDGALDGKVIIITGGGTGLGKSMGTYFSKLGASLVITSRKQEVLDKTAQEIEALTGVQIGLLTIYDMCKSADRQIVIGSVQLEEKIGGKSGHFIRSTA